MHAVLAGIGLLLATGPPPPPPTVREPHLAAFLAVPGGITDV